MIGAPDVAFPKLNLLSWYLNVFGGLVTLSALLAGGADAGWTFYTPLSSMFSNGAIALAAAGVFVTGFSSIATGVNFIATVHMLRIEGMGWFRMPLFVWAIYATSLIFVLATPVLATTLLLMTAERVFGLPVFDPANGGDPLLFQHLFWFYSHPAVYIMVLPAMGVVTEVITCFARRSVFGYAFMVYALVAIAGIGFFVWGHHMFVSGQSPFASLVFSFLSFVVAVPSAIKVFNWTATLYRGQISFEAPMLYALGFVGLFTVGGLTGLFLASIPGRHPCARHVFRDRAFPLHHGRRGGFGLFRRPAFLVAEDHRKTLFGSLGAVCGDPDVLRLQLHLLPAVHHGLCRHAAAISCLSAGVSGLPRDVDDGRDRAGRRLSAAAALSRLVRLPRQAGRGQSVGRERPRMGDDVAAAAEELRSQAPRSLIGPTTTTRRTRRRRPTSARRAGRRQAAQRP